MVPQEGMIALARLEEWMRRYYHRVDYDIGSSGVRDLTIAQLCELSGVELSQLGALVVRDSESYGGSRLRQALADRWCAGDTSSMMVTHGSSEAIYLLMHAAVGPGDEIIVVEPAYQQLHEIARWRGCDVVKWPLRRDDGFGVDLDLLETLVHELTRMIVVNFPHNPTGVTLTHSEQSRLMRIAAAADAWLLWDHAFGEITYTAPPLPLPRSDRLKSICIGTFSKSYGLAGLRVGWCVAPPQLLAQLAILRDHLALYVSPVLEFFAEQAVLHADAIVALHRRHADANRQMLLGWAREHAESVRLADPAGGVSALVEIRGCPDTTALCLELAERHRVLLVPGRCFADDLGGFVRLGFGGSFEDLRAGLERLGQLIK